MALLIYDVTRKQSFEEIQKYWIHQIKLFNKEHIGRKFAIINLVVAIVGNKADMLEKEEVDEKMVRKFAKVFLRRNLLFRKITQYLN